MLVTVLSKLRTGIGWAACGQGGHGTTAFKHWQRVVKAGSWEPLWRLVVANPEGATFTKAELRAATVWLLAQGALPGTIDDWLEPVVPKPLPTKPAEKPKRKPAKTPAKKRTARIRETPDGLWERFIGPALAEATPKANLGRKRKCERRTMDGLWFQTRTGCQWADVPRERGAYKSIHRWMTRWQAAGVFETVLEQVVTRADELGLVDWSYQCIDGTLKRARRGGKAADGVGANPTDRGRNGTKRSVLVERSGLPISIVVAGANIPDISLLQETMERRFRPLTPPDTETLIMDRGYRGRQAKAKVEKEGYIYRAPQKDRNDPYRKLDRPLTQEEKNIRGGVERCHSWMDGSRAILTRHSVKKGNYEAACNLTAIFLWWRRIEKAEREIETRTALVDVAS